MNEAVVKPLLVNGKDGRFVVWEGDLSGAGFFPLATQSKAHKLRASLDNSLVDCELFGRFGVAHKKDHNFAVQPIWLGSVGFFRVRHGIYVLARSIARSSDRFATVDRTCDRIYAEDKAVRDSCRGWLCGGCLAGAVCLHAQFLEGHVSVVGMHRNRLVIILAAYGTLLDVVRRPGDLRWSGHDVSRGRGS